MAWKFTLELLIIFIFQTPHVCWLIITLLVTTYVFVSAVHSHILPLEVAVHSFLLDVSGSSQAGILPTLNSNYVFEKKSYDPSSNTGRKCMQQNFLPV